MHPAHDGLLRYSSLTNWFALHLLIALGFFGTLPPLAFADPTGAEGSGGPPRRAVTLKQALQLAAQQSPDIAIARAQAAFAEATARRAYSAWQPDISANGTYDRTSAPARFDLGSFVNLVGGVYQLTAVNQGLIPSPVTIVGRNSVFGAVQISQPLFTPQGLFLIPPANRAAEAAQLSAQEAREQVLLGVSRAYLGLNGIWQLMEAAREAEQVALKREKDAQAQLTVGMAVETALLRAQAETSQARAQIADLEGTRESLLSQLQALTGQPIEPDLSSADDVVPTQAAELSTSPWEQTYSVRSAAKQLEAAQGSLNYDHFAWLPTLAAGARGNYTSNGGFAGVHTSYDLLLTINIPLYDRGIRYAALREDEAKLTQARAALESTRAKARATWTSARATVESAKAILAQAEAQAHLLARVQKQVETSAQAGVATNLELSDADQKRFQAASAAAQARANLQIRYAELAAAEGRLYRTVETQ